MTGPGSGARLVSGENAASYLRERADRLADPSVVRPEPNPPEAIIERLRKTRTWVNPGRPPLVYFEDAEAAVRAADSWWRSRLESDETVEAVARVIAGPAKCCCDDDWRLPPSRVCPVHGEGSWPYQSHYAKARAALASLIPVNEPETDTSFAARWERAHPDYEPETDT